jgi:hypothetical protein
MNSSIHSVFEPLFSQGNRTRQMTVPPSYLDTGMGIYFEGFRGCEGT